MDNPAQMTHFKKVFSFQKVGVCSRYAACYYRHHSIFCYRPYIYNAEQIQVFVCA